MCLISTPIAIGGLYVIAAGGTQGSGIAGGVIALLFGGVLGFLSWVAVLVGPDHLLLDPAAGTLDIRRGRTGRSIPLDQLGTFTITTHKRLQKSRAATWHKLEASGLPSVILLETISPKPVEDLKARLESAVATYAATMRQAS